MARSRQFSCFCTPNECAVILAKLWNEDAFSCFSIRFPPGAYSYENGAELGSLLSEPLTARYVAIRKDPLKYEKPLEEYWSETIAQGLIHIHLPVVRPSGGLSITDIVVATDPSADGITSPQQLFNSAVRVFRKECKHRLHECEESKFDYDVPCTSGALEWCKAGKPLEGW